MNWKAGGDLELPLADRNRAWDSNKAEEHIFEWARWEEHPNFVQAQRGFLAHDRDALENKSAYKLPFADVIDGKLKAVPRGIFAAAQVLQGARSGIDLPDDVIEQIRKHIESYYRKLGMDVPWKEHERAAR